MQKYESENNLHIYCDKCGSEIYNVKDLYEWGRLEICEGCLKTLAPKIHCVGCGTNVVGEDLFLSTVDKRPLCWECYKSVHRADPYDIY